MKYVRGSKMAWTLSLMLLAPVAGAEDTAEMSGPQPAAQAGAPTLPSAVYEWPSTAWHLYGGFGLGAADGKYGDVLQKPLQFEVQISKQTSSGKWRFGGGLQFGSMDPADDPNIPPETEAAWLAPDLEWARLETFVSATRVFNANGGFRPYVQGRLGIERIHPRSELFWIQPPPEDLEPGDSPTKSTNGIGFTVQAGFELALGRTVSLDAAAFGTYYKTGDYDMSPLGLPPVNSGTEWGGRLGLAWRPYTPRPLDAPQKALLVDTEGKPLPLPPPDADRDAWGVPRSWGWATAEMLAINFGASMVNEFTREANFNQISPRSFWANLDHGFTYDDNKFRTNQLIHPANGAMYYNAARANGRDFWGSSAMAIAGAFIWECCGETHPMSFNDMISTGIGGIARGEVMYRVSSLILDNTKRGWGRAGQEAGAFLMSPIRGFNRVVSGDASEVKGNPEHPYNYRPDFQLFLRAGGRVIGEGESISENTKKYGFFEWVLSYGDAWDPDNRRPYDRFDVTAQSNFGDKTRLGRLLIRGDLWSKLVAENHSLSLQQDFDYIDNEAFEYGGQSLGPTLVSRFELSDTMRLMARTQAFFIILGAVNSDLSFLADVAEQERIREYDYGPGAGGSLELYLLRKNFPLLVARYRGSYIDVSNGSVYNNDTADIGLSSTHGIQQAQVKLEIPVFRNLAIGADGSMFFRRSNYDFSGSGVPPRIGEGRRTITQRNPEARVFLTWSYSH
jgi:opacity protein-like surface antigen